MTTEGIARWALDLFVQVGGPDWPSTLRLGGITAIAFLVLLIAALGVLIAVERMRP